MRAAAKRTELVACRFTERELEQLKAAGDASELTVSEYVRQCVRFMLRLPCMVEPMRRPKSSGIEDDEEVIAEERRAQKAIEEEAVKEGAKVWKEAQARAAQKALEEKEAIKEAAIAKKKKPQPLNKKGSKA